MKKRLLPVSGFTPFHLRVIKTSLFVTIGVHIVIGIPLSLGTYFSLRASPQSVMAARLRQSAQILEPMLKGSNAELEVPVQLRFWQQNFNFNDANHFTYLRDEPGEPKIAQISLAVLTTDGQILHCTPDFQKPALNELPVDLQNSASTWRKSLRGWNGYRPVGSGPAAPLLVMQTRTDASSSEILGAVLRSIWSSWASDDLIFAPLVAFLTSWLATRPLLKRIKSLRHIADDWASGALQERSDDSGRDELGALSARLDAMASELEQLIDSRAQLAATQERDRLLDELHDSVKQRMFALSMQQATAYRFLSESQDKEAANHSLQRALNLTAQIQRDLHRIISPAMPIPALLTERETIEPLSLEKEMEELAQLWQNEILKITTQTRIHSRIDTEVWSQLRGIASEALANAVRHSGANQASVVLQNLPDGRLRLEITDNGAGFSPNDLLYSGRGLTLMQERAQKLTGGAFRVDSSPRNGCSITVESQSFLSASRFEASNVAVSNR